MGVEVERKALLASGLLPPGVDIDVFLWGEGNSERLEMRQGLLFLAGEYWGFYGRDYDFYTPYAGFAGQVSMISQLTGPQAHHGGMTSYTLEGLSDNDGEQTLTFFPDPPTYRQAKHEVEAFFDEVRRRVHNQLHPDAQNSFQQGLKAWNEGRTDEARSHLEQAYRQDPRSAMPPFYLGQLHLLDDPRTALKYLNESRQRGSTAKQELDLLLGQAYAALEDYRMAEKHLREALSGQETAIGHSLLAEVMAEQGRMREALRSAQRAAALEPNNLEMQALLAFCASQNGDSMTLERSLRRLGDRFQEHPFVLVALGTQAREQGDVEQARLLLEQALEISPDFRTAAQLLERLPVPEPTQIHTELQPPEAAHRPERTRLTSEPTRITSLQGRDESTRIDIGSQEHPKSHGSAAQFPFQLKMSTYLLLRTRQLQEELVQHVATFALQWAHQSLPLPDSIEACNLLLHSLQETFVLWLEPKVRDIGHSMESEFRDQWVPDQPELKTLSEAMLSVTWRQMFAELDASLEQVFQYSLGLMDGGLFLMFFQELMEEAMSPEITAQQLTEQLTLIPSKLYQRLKHWSQKQAEEVARELGPLSPPESTPTTERSEPPPPATPALPQRNVLERTKPDLPRIAVEPQYSSVPRPERPPRPGFNPIDKLIQEYVAAHHLLGLDVSGLKTEQMRGQLQEKLRMWEQRTGKEPDLYVRIEGGKPQIKIRAK